MKVPDSVHELAKELSEQRDTTMKEAVRMVFQESGYDV